MKKILTTILIFAIFLNLAAPAYCQGPARKLVRGIANTFTCFLEVPNRIHETYKQTGIVDAVGVGIPKGVVMMVFRLAYGLYETLTFPLPFPEDYEPIIGDPEFLIGKK